MATMGQIIHFLKKNVNQLRRKEERRIRMKGGRRGYDENLRGGKERGGLE